MNAVYYISIIHFHCRTSAFFHMFNIKKVLGLNKYVISLYNFTVHDLLCPFPITNCISLIFSTF